MSANTTATNDWNTINLRTNNSDKDIASDKEKNSFWQNLRKYFREYCNCTSIHGFRYFGEKRTIFERIWWIFIFIICIITCVYTIYLIYQKWDNSPVIVTFATKETPIYQVPFPAITICPEAKSYQSMFNYTGIMLKLINNETITNEEKTHFEHMALVCHFEDEISYAYEANETFTDSFYETISSVRPSFLVNECKFMGKEVACYKLFTPILTDEGICQTFNILNKNEIYSDNIFKLDDYHDVNQTSNFWNIEEGYSPNAPLNAYPRRALLYGVRNALSFTLYTLKEEVDYACKGGLQGYRIAAHIPMRVPRLSQAYFRLPLNQAVMAAITPNMITTSSAVRAYNPKKRQCYFLGEYQLKFYKTYSQLNCQMECLANYTLSYCGCVNYFMPRLNTTPICGTGSIDCMEEAEETVQMKNVRSHLLRERKFKKSSKNVQIDCDCLPICSDITYNAETSQVDINLMAELRAFNFTELLNISENDVFKSKLQLYFKSNQFITSERNVLYGPTDFLANFGGILGLFTGFSILSLMEILYFLTVRLICNVRLYGIWAGPED